MLCTNDQDDPSRRLALWLEKWGPWHSVLVVPLRGEDPIRVSRLLESLKLAASHISSRPLVIFVVNSYVESFARDQNRHESLLNLLKQTSKGSGIFETNHFFQVENKFDVLFFDFSFSEFHRFREKSGVGLARKLGSDLALMLFRLGLVKDSFLRNTDADVLVPVEYFLTEAQNKNAGAFIYRFAHVPQGDEAQQEAILSYEIYLRYLRLAMHCAESPYAYHSIGSLIAVKYEYYEKTRGFSDKMAGEDFYFLNKVRKLTPISWGTNKERVKIEGRRSSRVPFGTGRSVQKIIESGDWPFYHPQNFEILKESLQLIRASEGSFAKISKGPLLDFLKSRSLIEKFANIASQCKVKEQWLRRSMELFDAFEQLKFLHYLRDQVHANVNLEEALTDQSALLGLADSRCSASFVNGDLFTKARFLMECDESSDFSL